MVKIKKLIMTLTGALTLVFESLSVKINRKKNKNKSLQDHQKAWMHRQHNMSIKFNSKNEHSSKWFLVNNRRPGWHFILCYFTASRVFMQFSTFIHSYKQEKCWASSKYLLQSQSFLHLLFKAKYWIFNYCHLYSSAPSSGYN